MWGGTARASEPLRVVPVKLDTALVGSVLAQIDDLSAEALASNSSQGNAAATQLVGALAATLNTQGEESTADGNASGVTDTALVELREGLFAVLASGQAAEAEAAEAAGEKPDALAIAVTASAVEAVATGPQEQLSRASVEAGAGLVNKLA